MQQWPDKKLTLLPRLALCSGILLIPFAFAARAAEPPAPAAPATGQVISEVLLRSSYGDFIAHVNRQRRTNPAKTIAEMRAYLAEAAMTSSQIANFYTLLSAIYTSELRDNAAALAVLDEGLQALNNDPERYALVVEKVRMLAATGKTVEAEKLLQEHWTGIAGRGLAPRILPTYVALLTKNNKAALALQITRQTTADHIESARDRPVLIAALTEQLLGAGQVDEALGWNKLNFMLSAYNERALQNVNQLLARVWTAKDASSNKATQHLVALQDPLKPNPLRDVKLPVLDAATLRQRAQWTRQPEERVSLFIASGDWQAAVLAARRLIMDRPQSNQGVLQVCRVFMAHDLNIKRANAFIEYYTSSRGANPIAEFLSELEKR